MPRIGPDLLHLLTVQDNVVATWQVSRPTASRMRRAHNQGLWRQLTKHTYLAAPSEPTQMQRLWAAALHSGPDSLLTGQAALACAGWTGEQWGPTDVLIGHTASARGAPVWMRLHRTTVMPRGIRRDIPRAMPEAALIDAAGWATSHREAMFLVVSSLQQRIVSPAPLLRLLDDRPTARRRHLIRQTIDEFHGGATSMSEIDFGRLCRRYGIRKPDRQVMRNVNGRRYLDVHFDAEGVTVEIDGVHHTRPEVWIDDHERQNDLVIGGDRVFLRVSTFVLRYEPEVFMLQLRRALKLE